MPPRRRAQESYRGACPDCGLRAWHEPASDGVWMCNNCGYIPERQAQAVLSHANEKKTERIVPSHTDELKSHFDAGLKRLVEDILRQLHDSKQAIRMRRLSQAESSIRGSMPQDKPR